MLFSSVKLLIKLMAMKKKVVLAFSGGLDTSYCVKFLSEVKKLEVHTVTVNTGGFKVEELEEIEKKANFLGASTHTNLEETQNYYNSCVKYLIFGNVLKNNTYPLSVSAERGIQAMAIAKHAQRLKADYIAHGSTGAGNDQVRFDLIFNTLAPGIEIITPIRDNKLSRREEIEFLKSYNIPFKEEETLYSINKGLWGTSIGGKETSTSYDHLPETAFPTKLTKSKEEEITLIFEKGELRSVNGTYYKLPVDAIMALSELSSPFAIGRDMHIGDTIIGIKGRVGFEAAAPLIIIKAHYTLEKHVLTKWQLYWKEQLATWYGNLLHDGQFLDPLMRNIERFLEDMQKNVTGEVFITLAPYRFMVKGIKSPYDLMSAESEVYGEMNNSWSGEEVKGFSKITGNQMSIWHKINGVKLGKEAGKIQMKESSLNLTNTEQ